MSASRSVPAIDDATRRLIVEAVAEHSVDPLLALTDGLLAWIAPTVETTLGWLPTDIEGRPLAELCHPDERERFVELLRVVRELGMRRGVFRLQAKAGHHLAVLVSLARYSGGQPGPDMVGAIREIDQRVTAERALVDAVDKYRMLAEHASDVVVTWDDERRLTWVAPSVTRMLGWSTEELLGTRLRDITDPADRREADRTIAMLEAGRDVEMLLRLRTRGGEYRWMSGPAHPVQDAAGRTHAVTAGLRDVDELVRSRERLRATLDSQLEPNVTFEAVRDATGALVDLRYVDANGAALDYLRLTRERLVGATLLDISPGQLVNGPMRQYFHTIETGEPTVLDDYVYPLEIMAEDRHFDIRATRVGDGLTLTWHDVTDRNAALRRLAESEEHYRLLADNTSDVVALLRDGVIAWISPSVTDSFGGRPDQWVGRSISDILHPDDVEAHAGLVARADRGERAVGRVRVRTPEGAWHWVEIHMSQYVGAEGRVEGQITTAHVVDAEVEAEATLERMARFDSLTGLLNRGEVVRRLQAFTTHERTPGQQLGVLFCDVDEFKGINDVYGHAVGDLVLRTLAQRVTRAVRREDVVARMGGDELLVILSGVHDLDEVLRIAGKVRAGAGQPIALGTRGSGFVLPTLSIGATIAGSGEDADALLARADRAMYEAKQAGRNRVVPLPPTGSS